MCVRLMSLLLAAALLAPGSVFALDEEVLLVADSLTVQELRDYYGDETFITIATGSRKPIYRAPAVATVITAEEIKAMGARSLDEVLETVAGLHVAPSPLNRLDSIYSIRGIHSGFNPHTLVLMNGIPVTNLFNGGRPILFRYPVSSISRIEVIRGPGSAVYGADAFSGVINIVTKDASDLNGTEMGGRVGSFNTHDVWLQHGRRAGGLDVFFSLEWQKSDGDTGRRVDSDFQTILDREFATNASLAPGSLRTQYDVLDLHLHLEMDRWQWRNWYWQQNKAGQGAGGSQALDHQGTHTENVFLTDLTYTNADLLRDWELSSNLNFLYTRSESHFVLNPPGALVPIGEDGNINFANPVSLVLFPDGVIGKPGGNTYQTGLDLAAVYEGIDNHRWRFSTGFKHQKGKTKEAKNYGPGVIDGSEPVVDGTLTSVTGTPAVFMPGKTRTNFYLSVQDEWQFSRDWELTTGVRFDHYSDFGETINPRIALVWATLHNLTTKILYGRAFRAPSLSEQFAVNNPVLLGNANLSAETIDTLELAFDYRPIFDLQTKLNLFVYKAKDLIEFVPDPGGDSRTAQNARDQEGYGLEFEAIWRTTDHLGFLGNYAWQHSYDADTRRRIADAPGHQIYLAADWQFYPEWYVYPQVMWIGSRKRAADDARPEIKDYTLVGVTLRKQNVLQNMDMALAVRNLFDEDAREPSSNLIHNDYPLEGRQFWGEISYRF
jgi:outer membrane receptor for ferrienterochelin and colicins